MKPPKSVFACQECGAQSPKWLGRCPDCGAWNSLVEERAAEAAPAAASRYVAPAGGGARLYADIEASDAARMTTGIDEFDRVLGGGIVPGSLVLLGGEPGIGKSTLLLQTAAHVARATGPVLYSSGEESEHQIKSRGERLGVGDAPLYLLAETCLERVLEEMARLKPALVIVDSIQTVFSLKMQSAPGSIGQVREAATQLLFAAKAQNVPTFLVGHVTKEGSLAGPKALEHIVDTVLYFEGERHHSHRIVRAAKNRFGAVSELGVFEMTATGLKPVPNPSAMFLAERPADSPGLGRPLLHRGVAADSRRGAGAGQHQRLRVRQAHRGRPRPEPAVAPAGGAGEARGPGARRRRRVREPGRRHQRGRAGGGPRRGGGGRVELPEPADRAGDGGVRRSRPGRRGARHGAGRPPRARGGADGVHAVRHACGNVDPKDPGFAGTACALVGVRTVREALEHLLA